MQRSTQSALRRMAHVSLIGLYLNLTQFNAWADAVNSGAAAGQSVGQQVLQAFDGAEASQTLQDLFPDTGTTADLQSVYGDDNKTLDIGIQANTRLQTEASTEGEAYRVLANADRLSVDLSSDPMLNVADQVRDAAFMAGFKKSFADCSRTDVFDNVKRDAHIARYRTCERVIEQGGTYEFNHDYSLGVIEYVSGQPNFQSCGRGCLYIWVGTVGNNYWDGRCKVYEELTRFRVIAKGAILSATIDRAVFDDYFEIRFNDRILWTHTPGVFPPETPGACERSTSWSVSPNMDITDKFSNDNDVITFKTRTSVSGGGEGYARIKILFDPTKAYVDEGWGPQERLSMFDMIQDGYCKNTSMTCTSMPAVDASGCTEANGVTICRSDMPPSPHPAIDPLCTKARVSTQCSYYSGQMECYTDPQGVEHCPINEGGNLDTCQQYEQDPSCGFMSQACIEGAKGPSGACYAFEEVWDCGYDTSYDTVVNTGAVIDCPGGARCMGSECFDTTSAKSGDFAQALAMLQVAQFAEHDLDCGGDGSDISVGNECRVFKGEGMACKKALGGYIDCCEAPEGVSIVDYVKLTVATLKMASSLEALSRKGDLFAPGYWAAGSNAVMSAGTSVIKGEWGTILDSATAAFDKTLNGTIEKTALSKLQNWLMQQAYDAMVQMGATAAADGVFATGANGAVTGLGPQAAMVVNIIGWVYTVYVIADLLVNIIWECEQKEFELAAKKETRQCHFIGGYCASETAGSCVEKREGYCCYGSVVARIVQESAHAQLGLGYGTPEAPLCEGLTSEQLARVEWSSVDLSEWVGMLNLAGELPSATTVSLEHLTGAGSGLGALSEGDVRHNTLKRNEERLEGFDVDAVKRQYELDHR